ncbi:MAG: molybdopterin cofactor-binding domain-containing protein, partial [Pseudomonadota bacterium]
HRTAVGETYDGGDFPRLLNMLEEASDWAGVPARSAGSKKIGLVRGAGICFTLHATGGSTGERSEVRALPDGTVIVRTSSQDSGQSHRETLAIVASRALEIPVDRIRVEQGDTAFLETGGGTGGSNLMPVAANTVHRTALDMLERAKETATELLEVGHVDIDYGNGEFWIAGTDRKVSLARVAEHVSTSEEDPGCVSQLDFEGTHTTFPNGAMLCEVEVDPETGAVRIDRFICVNDLGEVFYPEAAEGQIHGGLAQGIGEALMEGMRFDSSGQPLTGSLMDYQLPRAADLPMFGNDWMPTNSPNAILGAKGVGELPSIGTPGLVVNAVLDALHPLGVRHIDKPITPVKVWQAIEAAKA